MNKPWKILANDLEQFQDAERAKISAGRADRQAMLALLELRKLGEFERIKRICKGSLALVAEIEERVQGMPK